MLFSYFEKLDSLCQHVVIGKSFKSTVQSFKGKHGGVYVFDVSAKRTYFVSAFVDFNLHAYTLEGKHALFCCV